MFARGRLKQGKKGTEEFGLGEYIFLLTSVGKDREVVQLGGGFFGTGLIRTFCFADFLEFGGETGQV